VINMRVNSLYIMLDDGRCIYNQYFTPTAPPKNLITGMFTALQGFIIEITGRYPTVLSTGQYTFFFQKRGPITIVLSTNEKIKQPSELSEIGLRFLQQFGNEVDAWRGNEGFFDDFYDDLVDLLGVEMTTTRVDPTKPLDPMTLLHLDSEYHPVIKELIRLKNASSNQIADILKDKEFQVRLKLEKLVDKGYIGRYIVDEDYYYFTN